jgi:hypothetical protein
MSAKKKNAKKEARATTAARSSQGNTAAPPAEEVERPKKLTTLGKMTIYLFFPLCVGLSGLLAAFFQQQSDPNHRMRIERDFALPFAMSMLLIMIVSFQTSHFTAKPQPLVKWPKVRKERKVRHVHVVKGQDPNAAAAAEDKEKAENGGEDKKND